MSTDKSEKNIVSSNVESFIQQMKTRKNKDSSGAAGRLIFAMDATASRQFSWDQAANIQSEMFVATSELGGIDIQLVFFRGFGEFRVSQWTNDSKKLLSLMTSVSCAAGTTQIGKVLQHALNQDRKKKVSAVVFIGDSIEEDLDSLGDLAGQLGLYRLPVFMFQEGYDSIINFAYSEIAKLSGGACIAFDANSADTLKELLRAVAIFAAGGRESLKRIASSGGIVKKLSQQMEIK